MYRVGFLSIEQILFVIYISIYLSIYLSRYHHSNSLRRGSNVSLHDEDIYSGSLRGLGHIGDVGVGDVGDVVISSYLLRYLHCYSGNFLFLYEKLLVIYLSIYLSIVLRLQLQSNNKCRFFTVKRNSKKNSKLFVLLSIYI